MKLSQFNIVAKDDDSGKFIIYNTLSTGLITLDEDTYKSIFEKKILFKQKKQMICIKMVFLSIRIVMNVVLLKELEPK